MTRTLARQISGRCRRLDERNDRVLRDDQLALLTVIFAPCVGGVTLGLAAVDMRSSPGIAGAWRRRGGEC